MLTTKSSVILKSQKSDYVQTSTMPCNIDEYNGNIFSMLHVKSICHLLCNRSKPLKESKNKLSLLYIHFGLSFQMWPSRIPTKAKHS